LPYRFEDDETLVMLTLAGEQSAYEALVIRHQKAVIASAMSVTHNQCLAEDAAQDAFVTAWMKLDTLQERSKYRTWVCKIAKNCARNMVMRMRSFMSLDVALNIDTGDDSKYNPAQRYSSSEESDELHNSIGKLPEKVRQIIHMHYFEGFSVAEIAERLMISEGTVKW
jgi:RNA polymerase sigma-70 factor (ECF subfamily)